MNKILVGVDGSLYIGEPRNHCIRKVWGVARRAERERRKGICEIEKGAHKTDIEPVHAEGI